MRKQKTILPRMSLTILFFVVILNLQERISANLEILYVAKGSGTWLPEHIHAALHYFSPKKTDLKSHYILIDFILFVLLLFRLLSKLRSCSIHFRFISAYLLYEKIRKEKHACRACVAFNVFLVSALRFNS